MALLETQATLVPQVQEEAVELVGAGERHIPVLGVLGVMVVVLDNQDM